MLAWPVRSDFTSVPVSSMPASQVSLDGVLEARLAVLGNALAADRPCLAAMAAACTR